MICLEFRFPAGRYHATPWGRHVNEGALEWPPSPWRLCRAFLAAGFNRLGWSASDALPDDARSLMLKLVDAPPDYELPRANSAHTRHYFPSPKLNENPTKVLDTFVHVGRDREDDVLRAFWPVDLDDAERSLLEALLAQLPYLGRAESWVEASLREMSEGDDARPNCRLWKNVSDEERSQNERIELLAPMTSEAYAAWLKQIATPTEPTTNSDAEASKKKSRAKSKTKKAPEDRLPADLIAALCRTPADWNSEGWSAPLGSCRLAYARSADALDAARDSNPKSNRSAASRRSFAFSSSFEEEAGNRPTAAILALSSDVLSGERLPFLGDVLRRTNLLHKALISHADKLGGATPCLTGMTSEGDDVLREHHGHTHLLPLILETDVTPSRPAKARIDHILVCARDGLDASTLGALQRLSRTWAKNLPGLFVTLAGLGQIDDFRERIQPLGESKIWVSQTPFVPPRFLKQRGANSVRGQILAELADRHLPMPSSIEIEVEGRGNDTWLPIDSDEGLEAFWTLWRGQRHPANVRLEPTLASTLSATSTSIDGAKEHPRRLATRWRGFKLERDKRAPKLPCAFGIRLRFDAAVGGPIALGYGAHFGLGLFVPFEADRFARDSR
ncbi:MAG: type I-U CRISPR-associated protein Cas5/Cas6 [Myxococcales bacterium]|jgi:CRISPR-associated protein Csb2|nr:type I-U CRISPR-associated protein Cas5/Cas6 [Myxococcales bacterium]